MKLIAFASLISISLNIQANGSLTGSDSIAEVVVTGTRATTDLRHTPMNITTITNSALNEDFRSSLLPTATEHVPGLFATSRGVLGYGVATGSAGAMKIRGIGGDMPNGGVLVLIDGMPQYTGLLGHSIADVSQTMMAERIEVLSGPASVIYGSNAMGGVLNIVTRKPQSDGIRTSVRLSGGSYGTAEAHATSTLRKGRFTAAAGIGYSHTDGHRSNSEFDQLTGFAKAGYDLSNHWNITGDVNITRFKSSTPGQVQDPFIDYDQDVLRGTSSLRLSNRYKNLSGALVAFYNWGHHEINDGYHPGGTPQTQLYMHDDIMGGVSLYESYSFGKKSAITVGADWHIMGGEAWNESIADGKRTGIADKTETELAGYASLQHAISHTLDLNIGIRADHHSASGTQFIPQGGFVWRPGKPEFKIMVSKGFRNPSIKEMYMFPPQNPDLKPETVINYEAGYKQQFLDNRLSVGADIYYLKSKDLIVTTRVDGKPLNVNINEAENFGTELKLCYAIGNGLNIDANYSYLHMSTPVIGAPEHKFYAGANYSNGKLNASAGLMYVGNLYTQTGGDEQTESYPLLHLTCSYRLTGHISIFAKGDNLLAAKYETLYGYPMPRATFMGGLTFAF